MQSYKGCYVFSLYGSKWCELFKKEKQVDTVKVLLWKKKNRNLIILHLSRITFLTGIDTSSTVLAAREQCKII